MDWVNMYDDNALVGPENTANYLNLLAAKSAAYIYIK